MTHAVLWIAGGVAVVAVLLFVVYAASVLRRGRRLGTRGLMQRSRLRCPHCGREFDYDWVPGVAFTAVRLGKYRYMACPLCHRWATFNIYDAMVPRAPGPVAGVGVGQPSEPPKPPLS